jgi:hypothetical protein
MKEEILLRDRSFNKGEPWSQVGARIIFVTRKDKKD